MNTNFNKIIKTISILLSLLVIAYIINIVLYLYLPKQKVVQQLKSNNELEYIRYDFYKSLKEKVKEIKPQKTIVKKKQEYQLLSNITIIAIIDLGDGNGVITITQKSSSSSIILGIGEEFKGYVLKEVYKGFALFEKNGKQYRVTLNLDDSPKFEIKKDNKIEKVLEKVEENIQVKGDAIGVKRDYLNTYIQNFDKIWKDIAISENRVGRGIDGFKINGIKKDSAFEKLGLKKGDIIKKVNNIELKSYNDAFKLYNKMDKTQALQITILRNNQEMEINYEIQ